MKKLFWMLDGRDVWHKAALATARRRGYEATRITQGHHAMDGIGFIRPHADPNLLDCHKVDYQLMQRNGCKMIQDPDQIELYENKSGQFYRWSQWMPKTWRYGSLTEALDFAHTRAEFPIVSKADVGASSRNVRVIYTRDDLVKHITTVFTKGIVVDHCSGGYLSKQRDYVLLQEFIPHEVTYRVNRIGNQYAIFKRYNYKDKPVAQTGNTAGVMSIDADSTAFLALSTAQAITASIGSKWVALDLLWCPKRQGFVLLETSLAWPWDVNSYQDVPFWHVSHMVWDVQVWTSSGRTWGGIWDVLFDELEAGAWD